MNARRPSVRRRNGQRLDFGSALAAAQTQHGVGKRGFSRYSPNDLSPEMLSSKRTIPVVITRSLSAKMLFFTPGDEHAGVRRALSVRDPASWQSPEEHCQSGRDDRFASAPVPLRRSTRCAGGEASILRSRTSLADCSARLRPTPVHPPRRRDQGRALSSMTCRPKWG